MAMCNINIIQFEIANQVHCYFITCIIQFEIKMYKTKQHLPESDELRCAILLQVRCLHGGYCGVSVTAKLM